MIKVIYAPSFLKQLKSLIPSLQDEAIEKIELFKNPDNHRLLKVHKLRGRLKSRFSFSVNFKTRIVFIFLKPKTNVSLLAIGDHEVYDS